MSQVPFTVIDDPPFQRSAAPETILSLFDAIDVWLDRLDREGLVLEQKLAAYGRRIDEYLALSRAS